MLAAPVCEFSTKSHVRAISAPVLVLWNRVLPPHWCPGSSQPCASHSRVACLFHSDRVGCHSDVCCHRGSVAQVQWKNIPMKTVSEGTPLPEQERGEDTTRETEPSHNCLGKEHTRELGSWQTCSESKVAHFDFTCG